jgi:hypothetical protein
MIPLLVLDSLAHKYVDQSNVPYSASRSNFWGHVGFGTEPQPPKVGGA